MGDFVGFPLPYYLILSAARLRVIFDLEMELRGNWRKADPPLFLLQSHQPNAWLSSS
ncbi:hypothetical protein SAMN05421863_100335 [Nitrosomonas communis]|uniref:Uncharacterized protein n=1 Tax=Nitrosomonas communis TaxID=44574 RepID=A0A1I4JYL8_9PROT|nr:hypothetical protein SAMN05421863_100335 [Nitrosomonas communis]